MVSVAHGLGRIQMEKVRCGLGGVYILQLAIFKNVFDVYNFSLSLNLFDSNKPLPFIERIIENVRRKCIIFGKARRISLGSKNSNKIFVKIIQKALIAITACEFLKFFWRSMPPDPPTAFLVSQSASNLFCRKKYAWKKCGNYHTAPIPSLQACVDLLCFFFAM